jgi:hypothetical protein
MEANFNDLPNELLLVIASSVSNLKDVSLVSKRLYHISACIAVQRAGDNPSPSDIDEAIRMIRCLDKWAQIGDLVKILSAHVRIRFVQDIHDRKMDDALQHLQSLGNLPANAIIPDRDFLIVTEAVLGWVLANAHFGIRDWFFPVAALVLLSRLPSSAGIPEKEFIILVGTVRGQIVQDLENGRHYFSSIMLRDLASLTLRIATPHNFFFNVVETARDSVVQSIKSGQMEGVKATLRVLRHLPVNTQIPDNFFVEVVETIRTQLQRTTNHDLYRTMKMLRILGALPSNTIIPDNYFVSVVAHFWRRLLQDIKNGVGFDAIRVLRMLRMLPANTIIPKDQFLRVEIMVRRQITRDLSNSRARQAARMIQVLRNLSRIDQYAFACVSHQFDSIEDERLEEQHF